MGRVYFPTKNDIGKRTLSGYPVLGSDYAGYRAPAEPAPRAVSTLVTLGSDYAGFRSPAEPAPRAVSTLATLGMMVNFSELEGGGAGGGTETVIRPASTNGGGISPPKAIGPIYSTALPVATAPIVAPQAPIVTRIITPTVSQPVIAQPAPGSGEVPNYPPPPTATPIYSIGMPTAAPQPVAAPPAAAPVAVPAAPPVSQQTSPTPTVSVPAAPSTGAVLVTSGGGTASPNVAPAAATPVPAVYTYDASGNIINAQTGAIVVPASQAASSGVSAASLNAAAAAPASSTAATSAPTDITNQIAAWLGGSTSIGSYSVPNALLAGAVILAFAWLESGGKKK